jgi:cell division septal protein FtsQ
MKAIAIQRNRKRRGRISWSRLITWLRPTLWAVLLGGGLFTLYVGGERLTTAPLFQVREVRWEGLHHLKESEMAARVGSIVGQSLFRVDLSRIQTELQANSWVKEAVVRKEFPDRLHIQVVERVPAAVEIGSVNRPLLRDEEGKILDQTGDVPEDLPRMIHFNPASYVQGLHLASLVSRTLRKEGGEASPFVIDLADPEDLVVHFPEGVLHFGDADYAERWERFLQIRDDLERRGISDREVDLRFRRKVIIKDGLTPETEGDEFTIWPGEKESRRGSQF